MEKNKYILFLANGGSFWIYADDLKVKEVEDGWEFEFFNGDDVWIDWNHIIAVRKADYHVE